MCEMNKLKALFASELKPIVDVNNANTKGLNLADIKRGEATINNINELIDGYQYNKFTLPSLCGNIFDEALRRCGRVGLMYGKTSNNSKKNKNKRLRKKMRK